MIPTSELTCPKCGHRSIERMPTDACIYFYDCKGLRLSASLYARPVLRVLFLRFGALPALQASEPYVISPRGTRRTNQIHRQPAGPIAACGRQASAATARFNLRAVRASNCRLLGTNSVAAFPKRRKSVASRNRYDGGVRSTLRAFPYAPARVDIALVVQIRFLEWTADGRLRHATYLGQRPDKAAKDVRRE